MPIPIARLRRWFAVGAIVISMLAASAYFVARWRMRSALREIPKKIGFEVQQSAQGFTISRSEQGHTIFTVRASKAVQFKQGGHAELHDVYIILYGRDSSRFDQIYGADFEYDPRSGDVTAKGTVQIDLEANPQGLANPDQVPPKELKNPIHLRTSGLVFNQKTGNAYTNDKVEFRIPQASGSAVGVNYVAKGNVLTLQSQIDIVLNRPHATRMTAAHGIVTRDPRQIVLQAPRVVTGDDKLEAEKATLFLRDDNTVERILASGEVQADLKGRDEMHARAAQAELLITHASTPILRTAVLSGDVQVDSMGDQLMHGSTGRVVLNFSGKNRLDKIHAQDGVKLAQHQTHGPAIAAAKVRGASPSYANPPASKTIGSASTFPNSSRTSAQDLEIAAPDMDVFVTKDQRLDRAETSGASQITIFQPESNQRTLVTAAKFEVKFEAKPGEPARLKSLHGAPDARTVTTAPGQPDRITASNALDVGFRPAGGIEAIVQQGNFTYVEGDRKAWSDEARYTPFDQTLTLSGSPRIVESGMTTTARSMRLNRATGDALADGDVKSTYSQLKEQPDGALLASPDPIHVTSRSMTAHRTPAVAIYTGRARLWQNANVVEAASIQFDRDRRSLTAQGNGQPVSTVLVQIDKSGKTTPVVITSSRLTYTDSERRIHFDGGVTAKGADLTITGKQMDAFLLPRTQTSTSQPVTGAGRLEKIVAEGNIVIQQPTRQANGERLVYTAADDKFVLTGGSPSIFDAEHGKITGDSLTFYKRDDRVLVEGKDTSPTVTHTRVAR